MTKTTLTELTDDYGYAVVELDEKMYDAFRAIAKALPPEMSHAEMMALITMLFEMFGVAKEDRIKILKTLALSTVLKDEVFDMVRAKAN